jgi:hypothetical protein
VVVQAATPVEVFTATAPHPPIVVESAVNATVPPVGTGETVAVKVTATPAVVGFAELVSAVDVEPCDTVRVKASVRDGSNSAVPENPARIVRDPMPRWAVVHDATPVEVSTATAPHPVIGELFSVNTTVPPLGTGFTVAV